MAPFKLLEAFVNNLAWTMTDQCYILDLTIASCCFWASTTVQQEIINYISKQMTLASQKGGKSGVSRTEGSWWEQDTRGRGGGGGEKRGGGGRGGGGGGGEGGGGGGGGV